MMVRLLKEYRQKQDSILVLVEAYRGFDNFHLLFHFFNFEIRDIVILSVGLSYLLNIFDVSVFAVLTKF